VLGRDVLGFFRAFYRVAVFVFLVRGAIVLALFFIAFVIGLGFVVFFHKSPYAFDALANVWFAPKEFKGGGFALTAL
jgi:hypothetical protein